MAFLFSGRRIELAPQKITKGFHICLNANIRVFGAATLDLGGAKIDGPLTPVKTDNLEGITTAKRHTFGAMLSNDAGAGILKEHSWADVTRPHGFETVNRHVNRPLSPYPLGRATGHRTIS